MNNRGSNIEVIVEVLRPGQARKTEIIHSANQSHLQLCQYLDIFSSRGFIHRVVNGNPKVGLVVTSKGKDMLINLEDVLDHLSLRILD